MYFFHHDRWHCSQYNDTVVDNVKSTDICGQKRCGKFIAWAYLYPFIGAMFLSDFNTIMVSLAAS